MRRLFLMVFQYTHILGRVSERRSQDRVPKLTGISGCCSTPRELSGIRRVATGEREAHDTLRAAHNSGGGPIPVCKHRKILADHL
jgi:hypothetical protein